MPEIISHSQSLFVKYFLSESLKCTTYFGLWAATAEGRGRKSLPCEQAKTQPSLPPPRALSHGRRIVFHAPARALLSLSCAGRGLPREQAPDADLAGEWVLH
jgi:hypothetical protein